MNSVDRFVIKMNFKNQIPNLVTLLNLISGSVAIFMAFSGEMVLASWFIIFAAMFDFLDGLVARLLKAGSDIGAQLDSLADVVSFGLAPSAIMYQLLLQSPGNSSLNAEMVKFLPYSALLLVACGAYRLAKFNTDPGQAVEFKGLPIPATGLFVAALPLIVNQFSQSEELTWIFLNQNILLTIIIILSILMVSNIPMISLKFKNLKWNGNIPRFILLGSVPILFLFFKYVAVPMIIILYVIISIISRSLKTKNS